MTEMDADLEMTALRLVAEAMNPLDGKTRARVLTWAQQRYQPEHTLLDVVALMTRHLESLDKAAQTIIAKCFTCEGRGTVRGEAGRWDPCPTCGPLRKAYESAKAARAQGESTIKDPNQHAEHSLTV